MKLGPRRIGPCRGILRLAVWLTIVGVCAAQDAPTLKLAFVGDIMLDESPGDTVARGCDVFAEFSDELLAADVSIGNLECVIATIRGEKADKSYHFRAHPRVISPLARYFDAICVANNHSVDFGPQAFVEQCELLERGGLAYFGGGRNLTDAHRPLVIERRGIRIALLGYNEYPPEEFAATETRAGVAWSHDDAVLRDIRQARSVGRADLVVPFMHWGEEFYEEPNERQKSLARRMIDAGANAVVGGHPHVTQGSELYQGRLIVYSLGNFVFNGFDPGPTRTGWLLQMTLSKQGLVDWKITTAHIDEAGIPRREPAIEAAR